ncbi:MAG TPA: phospholipase D-like domain-containing protein [Steroidobacteraceae bacterium]|nr:phospholipase D-like domain-containing protein [Steroidobacteraceae bacterium]
MFLLALLLIWAGTALWQVFKPMPAGTNLASDWVDTPVADVRWLADTTVTDGHGRLLIRQHVFDEVLGIIGAAKQFVVLDFYLFNDWPDAADTADGAGAASSAVHRKISEELKARLIARRKAVPDLKVLFITDPVNDLYGAWPSAALAELRGAGVDVVITDLDILRDPNPAYSALWRPLGTWSTDHAGDRGALANPLDVGPETVSLPMWLRMFNFKANHRKTLVADDGRGGLVALLTSADANDGGSAHSNVGLRFGGPLARTALDSELRIARLSGWQSTWQPPEVSAPQKDQQAVRLRYLSEGAIERELLAAIETAHSGESISIAALYLSDRDVIDALRAAAARDVRVRLILDPNKDMYGRQHDGVPNRPAAAELVRQSGGRIECRWYRTHGEQFHATLAMVRRGDALWAMLGSAQLTRRQLDNFNLNADVALEADLDTPLAQELVNYFETLWQNDPVALREYTTDFQIYEDQSFPRYWRYRLMEAAGLGAF